MRIPALLFALMVLLSASAQSRPYAQDDSLTMSLAISDKATINPLGDNFRIDRIQADLLFYPRVGVSALETIPTAIDNSSSLVYVWENPSGSDISLNLNSQLESRFSYPLIPKKITFPILRQDPDLLPYITPQNLIDSNDTAIIDQAASLVQGQDDLYEVVFSIARFVGRSVSYNLTTSTATVSQRASWVLRERYGVCDEITTLFIAMVRSLGIPARYVSGLAYSNLEGSEGFGPHAWAEVYFPGAGWVPFDVTYREYGMLDATHIPLAYSLDAGGSSVRYTWLGWMADVESHPLDFDARVLQEGRQLSPIVELELAPYRERVGFGSAMLLTATLTNPDDAYLPLALHISSSRGLTSLEGDEKDVLLLPSEQRSVTWLMQVDKDLDPAYYYTFVVELYTGFNDSARASFIAAPDAPILQEIDLQKFVKSTEEGKMKTYSRKVELNCSSEKESYYPDETPMVDCRGHDIGTVDLDDLTLCLNSCVPFPLHVGEERTAALQSDGGSGYKDVTIVLNGSQVSKTSSAQYVVWDEPKIEVVNITHPSVVRFDDAFQLEFTLAKTSLQPPKNVRLSVSQGGFRKDWVIPELAADRSFFLAMEGANLDRGTNDFTISADYEDGLGKTYNAQDHATMELVGVTIPQQLVLWVNGLGRGISSFDLRVFIAVAFAIGIAVGIFIVRGAHEHLPEDDEIDEIQEEAREIEEEVEKKTAKKKKNKTD